MTLKELNDLYAKIGSNYTAEIQSAYKKFEIDYIKYLDMYRSHENERKIALSQIMAINS